MTKFNLEMFEASGEGLGNPKWVGMLGRAIQAALEEPEPTQPQMETARTSVRVPVSETFQAAFLKAMSPHDLTADVTQANWSKAIGAGLEAILTPEAVQPLHFHLHPDQLFSAIGSMVTIEPEAVAARRQAKGIGPYEELVRQRPDSAIEAAARRFAQAFHERRSPGEVDAARRSLFQLLGHPTERSVKPWDEERPAADDVGRPPADRGGLE